MTPVLANQAKSTRDAVVLNERPRKTLGYEPPAERFNKCVHPSVELTTQGRQPLTWEVAGQPEAGPVDRKVKYYRLSHKGFH